MRKSARAFISWWLTPLWRATLLGITLGAAMGAYAFYSMSSGKTEANALIRIEQPIDPDQILTATAPSPESLQAFLSGEMTYLASPGFAAAVGKSLNQSAPAEISAVQNGQSSVVTLSTTAQNSGEAARVINAAIQTYTDHVHQLTRDRAQSAIDALTGVLNGLEEEQKRAQESGAESGLQQQQELYDANGNPVTFGRQNDVKTQIGMLDQQRQSIAVQLQRPAGVQVVQPPTKVATSGAPSWSLGAVGGGLLGGMLGLGVALSWRRRSRTIVSPNAIEEFVDNVLLPVVPLTAVTGLGELSADDVAVARSLYAQLLPPRTGRLLLIGVSAESGCAQLSRLLASAAAEHRDVALVHLLDGSAAFRGMQKITAAEENAENADPLEDPTTIIDGGSLDASPTLPEVVAHASQIVLVAMIGRDTVDGVRMAHLLTRASGVPVSAICTRGKGGNRHTRRDQSKASKPPGRHQAVPAVIGRSKPDTNP